LLEYSTVTGLGDRRDAQLSEAYRACMQLAARHYENFPVASRLLPPRMRRHVAAVYAFARVADDVADEGDRSAAERHELLDEWHQRLDACFASAATTPAPAATRDSAPPRSSTAPSDIPPDLVFMALGDTVRRCRLPKAPLEDLLSAFRQDITTRSYDSWDALLDYCRRSADPIGRLVLQIAWATGAGRQWSRPPHHGSSRARDDAPPKLLDASDHLCTALQLTNFWQDLAIDWQRGRLYVPREVVRATGADEQDLTRGRLTPAWREALRRAAARTRQHFEAGRAVCNGVTGRLRFELRVTWLGGMAILDRLEASNFDPLTSRPTIGLIDVPKLLLRALAWREAA
jgi:phytoene/squalene synthetase